VPPVNLSPGADGRSRGLVLDGSFVLPCLGEEATVGQRIGSVAGAFRVEPAVSYEIIVAGDGSTDRSALARSEAPPR
jgi:hypothetical protein